MIIQLQQENLLLNTKLQALKTYKVINENK
jgi:hypothetical protein